MEDIVIIFRGESFRRNSHMNDRKTTVNHYSQLKCIENIHNNIIRQLLLKYKLKKIIISTYSTCHNKKLIEKIVDVFNVNCEVVLNEKKHSTQHDPIYQGLYLCDKPCNIFMIRFDIFFIKPCILPSNIDTHILLPHWHHTVKPECSDAFIWIPYKYYNLGRELLMKSWPEHNIIKEFNKNNCDCDVFWDIMMRTDQQKRPDRRETVNKNQRPYIIYGRPYSYFKRRLK